MAEISISACRTALQWAWCRRQAGIPLKLQGRQVVIDRPVEARGKYWVCGDLELGRAEKVALTKEARRIIAEKVTPQPPWAFPPGDIEPGVSQGDRACRRESRSSIGAKSCTSPNS